MSICAVGRITTHNTATSTTTWAGVELIDDAGWIARDWDSGGCCGVAWCGAGNRDMNKLRFMSELAEGETGASTDVYW